MGSDSSTPFQATWADLPDPRDEKAPDGGRCEVRVNQGACRHIARHFRARGEPWRELLDRPHLAMMARIVDAPPGADDHPLLAEVVACLEQLARRALGKPLVLLYRASRPGVTLRMPDRWLLVLPCGATMVIGVDTRGSARLTTCFYSRWAIRERNPNQRWRRVAASWVRRTVRIDTELKRFRLRGVGDPPVEVDTEYGTETRSDHRFVSLGEWGFVCEQGQWVWMGRLRDWGEPAPPAPPAAASKFRLRPRRRIAESEEGNG